MAVHNESEPSRSFRLRMLTVAVALFDTPIGACGLAWGPSGIAGLLLPAATPLLALQGKEAVMRAARIEGSAEFAQALGFVIRNLRWDAEEDLSRLVGDVAAHRIVKGGKEFVAWQQQAAQNFAANLAEFFTEEQPLIAKQGDIAAFSADIDRLRDDVARLEKRLGLLG